MQTKENLYSQEYSLLNQKSFSIPLEFKENNITRDPQWLYIDAYASVFNNIDLGNDIMAKGAFSNTLAKDNNIVLLFNHDMNSPIGTITNLYEDDKGLKMQAKISRTQNTDVCNKVIDGIENRYLNELSIGFQILKLDYKKQTDQNKKTKIIRKIQEVELYEVSVVTLAMNPLAMINDFKSFNFKSLDTIDTTSERDCEKSLKDLGFSSQQAKTLLSKCKSAILSTREERLKEVELKSYNEGWRDANMNLQLETIKNQLQNINNLFQK